MRKSVKVARVDNGLLDAIGAKVRGVVKRKIARGKAKRAYGKELRLSSKAERAKQERQEAEREAMKNPSVSTATVNRVARKLAHALCELPDNATRIEVLEGLAARLNRGDE